MEDTPLQRAERTYSAAADHFDRPALGFWDRVGAARGMRQDFVTFDVSHALMVCTNYKPVVTSTDHATWRRLELVKFPFTYRKPTEQLRGPDDRRGDPGLRPRVLTDRQVWEAALATIVEHSRHWYERGKRLPGSVPGSLPEPPRRVADDTMEWRGNDDLVLRYFDEQLVPDREAHIQTMVFTNEFFRWLDQHGYQRWGERLVANRFEAHDGLPIRMRKDYIRPESGRYGKLSVPDRYAPADPPSRYHAWLGVRFRTVEDDLEDDL